VLLLRPNITFCIVAKNFEHLLPHVWCVSQVTCGKLYMTLFMDFFKKWLFSRQSSIKARFVQYKTDC